MTSPRGIRGLILFSGMSAAGRAYDPSMSGSAKGLLLAMLNVVVVALGFATTITNDERLEIAIFAVYIGLIPALLTGIFVGKIADTQDRFRLPIIAGIPLIVVVFLGLGAQTLDVGGEPAISSAIIGFACIPTTVGAIILERWTRRRTPQPVPPAHAVRS
jgi:hypothetical protein